MAGKTPELMITADDLPLVFKVKYLGHHPAKGLWGIKHTRQPIDNMVAQAKTLPPTIALPLAKVEVTSKGLTFVLSADKRASAVYDFNVDSISYGVQDVIYTRVFCMIVVEENVKDTVPFECHAFVCESRHQARKLTYALAAVFQEYGKKLQKEQQERPGVSTNKFAIDLRTPEELEDASDNETEA